MTAVALLGTIVPTGRWGSAAGDWGMQEHPKSQYCHGHNQSTHCFSVPTWGRGPAPVG